MSQTASKPARVDPPYGVLLKTYRNVSHPAEWKLAVGLRVYLSPLDIRWDNNRQRTKSPSADNHKTGTPSAARNITGISAVCVAYHSQLRISAHDPTAMRCAVPAARCMTVTSHASDATSNQTKPGQAAKLGWAGHYPQHYYYHLHCMRRLSYASRPALGYVGVWNRTGRLFFEPSYDTWIHTV